MVVDMNGSSPGDFSFATVLASWDAVRSDNVRADVIIGSTAYLQKSRYSGMSVLREC
jgi:hypothetical protein